MAHVTPASIAEPPAAEPPAAEPPAAEPPAAEPPAAEPPAAEPPAAEPPAAEPPAAEPPAAEPPAAEPPAAEPPAAEPPAAEPPAADALHSFIRHDATPEHTAHAAPLIPHAVLTSPAAHTPFERQHPLAQFCGVHRSSGGGQPTNTVTARTAIIHVFVDIIPPPGTPSGSGCRQRGRRRDGPVDTERVNAARRDENEPGGVTCPPRSPRSEMELLFRRAPSTMEDSPGRTGLRTHRPRRSSRHLLTVASQAPYRPSALMTAFVPAHRCGAAPDSHRVPLTDALRLGRSAVAPQSVCLTTNHFRRAATINPAASGSSATASPPPQPDAFRTGVGTHRPLLHERPRSQSREDRQGSRVSFSSDVMSGPPMPADASGIDASSAKACAALKNKRATRVRFIVPEPTSLASNVGRTSRSWAVYTSPPWRRPSSSLTTTRSWWRS